MPTKSKFIPSVTVRMPEPVRTPPDEIVVTMSPVQAAMIVQMLRNVAGHPNTTYRHHADTLSQKLQTYVRVPGPVYTGAGVHSILAIPIGIVACDEPENEDPNIFLLPGVADAAKVSE